MAKVAQFFAPNRMSITIVYLLGLLALIAMAAPNTAGVVVYRLREVIQFFQNSIAYTI